MRYGKAIDGVFDVSFNDLWARVERGRPADRGFG
jgi:hypothetical protein